MVLLSNLAVERVSEKRRSKSPQPPEEGGVRVKVPLLQGDLGGLGSKIEAKKTFQTPSEVLTILKSKRFKMVLK
jgi:hypothetical protein